MTDNFKSLAKTAAWSLIAPAYILALFIADALHSVPSV